MRSRLTEKLAKMQKNVCAQYYVATGIIATPEEKQIGTHLKME